MSAHPLLEGLEHDEREVIAPACAMVVFGAAGDLCTRKLLRALRALARRGELPGGFSLVGVARTVFDDDQFRGFACGVGAGGSDQPPEDRSGPS